MTATPTVETATRAVTEKQRRFVEVLLSNGGNARRAYLAAFNTTKAGGAPQRLLRKPHVVAYLRLVQRALPESQERSAQPAGETAPGALVAVPASAETVQRSREWLLSTLETNLARAMQIEPVRDADGNATGEYRYDGAVANKALELIARIEGFLVERRELTLRTVSAMSDEELAQRRTELRRQIEMESGEDVPLAEPDEQPGALRPEPRRSRPVLGLAVGQQTIGRDPAQRTGIGGDERNLQPLPDEAHTDQTTATNREGLGGPQGV